MDGYPVSKGKILPPSNRLLLLVFKNCLPQMEGMKLLDDHEMVQMELLLAELLTSSTDEEALQILELHLKLRALFDSQKERRESQNHLQKIIAQTSQ